MTLNKLQHRNLKIMKLIEKLIAFATSFNTAKFSKEDVELEQAVLATAKAFHLQVISHADVGLSEPLVNVDGLDRYAFKGGSKLGLPARVLTHTLHSEVLKRLPENTRAALTKRLSITAPVRGA